MSNESIDNTVTAPNRKFLHRLTKAESGPYLNDEYEIAGILWNGFDYGTYDGLTGHPSDNVILDIRGQNYGIGFTWSWSLKIADGVYVRQSGTADDIDAAGAAATSYSPRRIEFDYLTGITTWYETEPGSLTAAIDGEEANIRAYGTDLYRYTRIWNAGSPVFDCLDYLGKNLNGIAPTLEAAMIGCIDAPDTFKRACAALVASLRISEVAA